MKSLEQIYDDIDKLEKSTVSVKKYQQIEICFALFDGRLRLVGGATDLVANHLEEVAMKRRLKRSSCHVEQSAATKCEA